MADDTAGKVHIYCPTGQHYRIRYRGRGERKWTCAATRFRSFATAAVALATSFAKHPPTYLGEVILCADMYDPLPVLTMRRS